MPDQGAVEVSGDLAARLGDVGGGGIAVFDSDARRAQAGLEQALRALAQLRHPEEPEDALVKFISKIGRAPGGGVGVWFDAPDLGALDQHHLVVETVIEALEEAGVVGRMAFIDSDLLVPDEPIDRPEPWTGEVVPTWLPIPPEAVDVEALFVEGTGSVLFWVALEFDVMRFYERQLLAAGFELGERSSTVGGELPTGEVLRVDKLQFRGRGRDCKITVGHRNRWSSGDPTVLELKVHVRCELD
jgi:hypothetical protein